MRGGDSTPPDILYECESKRVAQRAFCKCMKTTGGNLVALGCCGSGEETIAGRRSMGLRGGNMGFAENTEVTGSRVDFTRECSIDYLSCQAVPMGIIVRTLRDMAIPG